MGRSKVGQHFATAPRTECSPRRQVDALADKLHAAVAAYHLDSSGMIASGAEDAVSTGAHIWDIAVGIVVVVVAAVVLASVNPARTSLPCPAAADRYGHGLEQLGIARGLIVVRQSRGRGWNGG